MLFPSAEASKKTEYPNSCPLLGVYWNPKRKKSVCNILEMRAFPEHLGTAGTLVEQIIILDCFGFQKMYDGLLLNRFKTDIAVAAPGKEGVGGLNPEKTDHFSQLVIRMIVPDPPGEDNPASFEQGCVPGQDNAAFIGCQVGNLAICKLC